MAETSAGAVVVDIRGNLASLKKSLADAKTAVVDFNSEAGKTMMADFNKRLDEIADNLKKLSGRVKETEDSFKGFNSVLNYVKGGLAVIGIDLSIRSLIDFTKEVIHSTASLDIAAATIGTSTNALQAYRAAAVTAGQSIETSDNAIRFFTRSVGSAEVATGNQRAAFQKLGITANDLAGGAQALLPRVAAALLNISNVSTRARLEVELFGRSGQAVEPLLKSWQTPVDQLIAKFKDLGLIIDEETIKKASQFESAWSLAIMKVKSYFASFLFASLSSEFANLNATAKQFEAIAKRIPSTGNIAAANTARERATVLQREMMKQAGVTVPFAGPGSTETKDEVSSWSQALDKYLAQLRIAAQLAKDTVDERRVDEQVIAAATAKLQDQADVNHQYVRDLADAREIAGQKLIYDIKSKDTIVQASTAAVLFEERIRTAQAAVGSFAFNKEFTAYLDKLAGGDTLKANIQESIGRLSKGSLLTEENAATYIEITKQLKEQVALSGMSADMRERESAVLQIDVQFNRTLSDTQKDQIRNLIEQRQAAENIRDALVDVASETTAWLRDVRNGANVFTSLFSHMEKAFESAVDRMVQKWIESQLFSLFGNIAGGAIGGGSFISGGLGAESNVFITPGLFHDGWDGRSSASSYRTVRASTFASAPRYHSGLRPDERPAILQVGEQVLSRQQVQKGAGGGSLHINVNVNGARGNMEIQQMVMEGVKSGLASYDRDALPSRVDSLTRDPRMR